MLNRRMLYHLNLVFDDEMLPDAEGMELPDIEAACFHARKVAREIIGEEAKNGRIPLEWSIEIVDESGDMVAEIPFRDAVTLH